MKNQEIEEKIRIAVEHTAPHQLDAILSACQEQKADGLFQNQDEKGTVIAMTEYKNKNKNWYFYAVAAVVLLLIGGWLSVAIKNQNHLGETEVDMLAAITFDVNPSVELIVNTEEIVTDAIALNEDGTTVLGGMNLVGTNLETAVNALVGSFLTNGYLDELQNAILVSVENYQGDSKAFESELSSSISTLLKNGGLEAAVFLQSVSTDETLTALAEQYGISMGKAALIQEIIEQDNTLTFDAMAQLTITELALVAENRNLTVSSVSRTGTVSDRGYIGATAALEYACQYIDVGTKDVQGAKVELDGKNGTIIYEVEYYYNGIEYEFEIDAISGEVLSLERESDHKNSSENLPESAESMDQSTISTETTEASSSNDSNISSSNNGSGTYIGTETAELIALNDANVSASAVKYINSWIEYDDGRAQYYEVEFAVYDSSSQVETVYEYEIDLVNGTILKKESENYYQGEEWDGPNDSGHHSEEDSHHDSNVSGTSSCIGESAALTTAYKHANIASSEVTMVECELDEEDNMLVYEIEFKVGKIKYEYKVNAVTGAIISYEWDD
ncbi:MAG: PepSY domain-containing protein [Lachnospiraceae bacterium]